MEYAGKQALVVGCEGWGGRIALALAREGARVWCCGHETGAVAELAAAAGREGLTGLVVRWLDREQDEALSQFVREAGEEGLDLLVFAVPPPAQGEPVDRVEPEAWSRALDGCLRLGWKSAVWALPALRRRPGAAVVFASSADFRRPDRHNGVSAVCSAGLEAMVRVLASELARDGIRVNLAAGGLEEDLTGAALFLASPAASYCTGSTVVTDGVRRRERREGA